MDDSTPRDDAPAPPVPVPTPLSRMQVLLFGSQALLFVVGAGVFGYIGFYSFTLARSPTEWIESVAYVTAADEFTDNDVIEFYALDQAHERGLTVRVQNTLRCDYGAGIRRVSTSEQTHHDFDPVIPTGVDGDAMRENIDAITESIPKLYRSAALREFAELEGLRTTPFDGPRPTQTGECIGKHTTEYRTEWFDIPKRITVYSGPFFYTVIGDDPARDGDGLSLDVPGAIEPLPAPLAPRLTGDDEDKPTATELLPFGRAPWSLGYRMPPHPSVLKSVVLNAHEAIARAR